MNRIAGIVVRAGLGVALALFASAAPAAPAAAPPPARTSALTVYGNDPCPAGEPDEIVVCAREPESERFRIPKKLRDKGRDETGARSWTDQVAGVEETGRQARPNSCSVVGSGGQSGCTQAMLRQWFAERQAAKAEAADIP